MTYRESGRAPPKELRLVNRDSTLGRIFGLAFATLMMSFGALAALGLPSTQKPGEVIYGLLFLALGLFGVYVFRAIVLDILTNVYLLRDEQKLVIEWRRLGKIKKSVDSRLDALSLSLREGTYARSGEKHWTVVLGTDGADVDLGGPYDLPTAEARKADIALFLALDTVTTTRIRVDGKSEVVPVANEEPLDEEQPHERRAR